MTIQWIYLPDNIEDYIGKTKLSKKNKNKKKKKNKTSQKSKKYKTKKELSIHTSYTLEQTKKILKILNITTDNITVLPKTLKSNKSIINYLSKKDTTKK